MPISLASEAATGDSQTLQEGEAKSWGPKNKGSIPDVLLQDWVQ